MLNAIQLRNCSIGPVQRWHCKDITCLQHRRFCILCGVFWAVRGNGQCYYSNGLDSLAAEAVEGLRRLLELLLVITHFFEGG
jgi:hypothetical protein